MAQVVKLKRTSVEGRKPTTSNLELGELAINTFDGKIYFEKDNGTPSIREIATEDSYYFYTTSLDSRYVNLTGDETIAGNKTFSNNITISGNLSVEGTTTTIDSTTVNIGDNTLELNYGGSQTSGGILIKDATGSSTVSGSLLWDSTNDYWKAGKLGSEEEILLRNTHGVISGSSQIDHDTTTNFVANEHIDHSSITIGSGKGLSGGGTITTNRSLSLDTGSNHFANGVKTKLDADSVISGSNLDGMTVSGSFSGSFQGDGSNLTGVTTEISEVATVTDTFTNATSKVVTHNFGTKNVIVTVYGDDDSYFIPNSIVTTNTNQVTVTFASTESGRVVVAKGGHIVNGVAADDSTLLDGENAAYYLNYNNHTNTPTTITTDQANKITANDGKVGYTDALVKTKLDTDSVISGSSQVVSSLSNQDIDLGTGDITATTGSFDVIDLDRLALTSTQTTVSPLHLTATNLNDGVGALRIDGAQADIYLNPTTSTHTTVTFAVGGSPKLAFGMDSSDDFYITRNNGTSWYDDTFVLDRNTGEVTLGYDLTVNGNINATNGIISGSSQITDLTTHKETVSGASSYTVDHNLNEQYPIVQAWNTATSQQELPNSITTNSANRVTVTFSITFAGIIIVKK